MTKKAEKSSSSSPENQTVIPFLKAKGDKKNKNKKNAKRNSKVGISVPEDSGGGGGGDDDDQSTSSAGSLLEEKSSSAPKSPGPSDPHANPLKNMPRARVLPGLDVEDVATGFDFTENKGDEEIDERRERFAKEAEDIRAQLARRPEDDKSAGGTADIMALFAKKEDEQQQTLTNNPDDIKEEGSDNKEGGGAGDDGTPRAANAKAPLPASASASASAAAAQQQQPQDGSTPTAAAAAKGGGGPRPELAPVWRNPSTGEIVPVEQRREMLRTSPAYKASWEAALARCIKQIGKEELEKRVALLAAYTAGYATAALAFCALAECDGVVQHAVEKLKLVGYRDEMALAAEVTNAKQYVHFVKKEEKKNKEEAAAQAAGMNTKDKRGAAADEALKPVIWKDPVTGTLMDSEKRKLYLLSSPAYKQCWEEVLGKLVKGSEKGLIEKGLHKICGTLSKNNPKVTPEVAFCALAECLGIAQHAIAKLRHPGYVEEMRIADECCKVSQYVRVSKKAPTKSKREGEENTDGGSGRVSPAEFNIAGSGRTSPTGGSGRASPTGQPFAPIAEDAY